MHSTYYPPMHTLYHPPQALAPRVGPINRGIESCYDCAAAPGQRHTNLCALSPAHPAWASAPFAFAPWVGIEAFDGRA